MIRYKFDGIIKLYHPIKASSEKEAVEMLKERILDAEVNTAENIVKTPKMSLFTSENMYENGVDEPYLTIYDGMRYRFSTKICRISLLEPKYIKVPFNGNDAKDWILNKNDIRKLIKLLNNNDALSIKTTRSNKIFLTNWEYAIISFNRVSGYGQEKTEKLIRKNPKYIKKRNLLPFNLPMPDYTKLQ